MVMEKITLFFCDIYGTFDNSAEKSTDIKSEIKIFTNNLEKIKEKNNSNKIIFSFVTTETIETIIEKEALLKESSASNNIIIGKHFYSKHKADVTNKAALMLNYIKELEKNYIIDEIYYADDCEFYHLMLYGLKKLYKVNYFINSIIPKNNGIIDVNYALENEYIKQKQKMITKA